jgi:hypothetical protein
MPIDEPISALEALNASAERQSDPVLARAKCFLEVLQLFSPPGVEKIFSSLTTAYGWLGVRAEQNRRELAQVVAEEVKRHSAEMIRLWGSCEEYRRFMKDVMPGLILDALRRAEQLRAKERIRRLGLIVMHAARVGPQEGADQVEEMMRIAADMTDEDVLVLKRISETYDRYLQLPAHAGHILTMPGIDGVERNAIVSICGKLQSLGLIATPERHAAVMGEFGWPPGGGFVPLVRGQTFLKFVAETTD